MAAKDLYHDLVKEALIQDGWTITHDPLHLRWGKRDFYVDLGAQQILGAEKDDTLIAVEIKSFISYSSIRDLEVAVGQYMVYLKLLQKLEPHRILYLAVKSSVFESIFSEPIGKLMQEELNIKCLIFDENTITIEKWIN